MKKIVVILFAVLLCTLTLSVSAEDEYYRLQDIAEILTETENEELLATLDSVSERQGMDIAILTVDAVEEGLTVEQDATEWYEYLGYDTDGVMLYISMAERDWYILTSGFGITAITDAGIDYISDKFVSALSDGNYSGAFGAFVKYTDEFITQAKTGEPYDRGNMPKEPFSVGMSLVISFFIGLIIAAIITSVWKSSLTSVKMQTAAANYMKEGSLNVGYSRDFFLYRHIDRTEKEKKSSGGSSTHTSSSGNTYGGGGGKF